jgi:hypothetical protein
MFKIKWAREDYKSEIALGKRFNQIEEMVSEDSDEPATNQTMIEAVELNSLGGEKHDK